MGWMDVLMVIAAFSKEALVLLDWEKALWGDE